LPHAKLILLRIDDVFITGRQLIAQPEKINERGHREKPLDVSSWPDDAAAGRPRSATVAICSDDGGVIGT
jgi:hypothetical protein